MCISNGNATVDRIIDYLKRNGLGVVPPEKLNTFKLGLYLAVYGEGMRNEYKERPKRVRIRRKSERC